MDIKKASDKLSQLNIQLMMDNYVVDILWFRMMETNGDWCINRHTHSTFEFHIVAEGGCSVSLDDGEFTVTEGEFYVTAPGVYHEQSRLKDCGHYVEYSINYDFIKQTESSSEADLIFKLLSAERCRPIRDRAAIGKLFEEALREAYDQEIGFFNNIKYAAERILILAARMMNSGVLVNSFEASQKLKNDDDRFILIQKFVEDNLNNSIIAKDLSDLMFLSEKQVYRIIKSKTGKSTIKYINALRLKKAKELLKNTEQSIKTIAESLGFKSEYYFNQFFRREEGYPPGIYRKNIRNV